MRMNAPLLSKSLIIAGVLGTVVLFVGWSQGQLPKAKAYHSAAELRGLRGGFDLPIEGNTFFKGSGTCDGCHGLDDIPSVLANHNAAGEDVNPVDSWRSTMMGNSPKKP